jgi:hypothetical protein
MTSATTSLETGLTSPEARTRCSSQLRMQRLRVADVLALPGAQWDHLSGQALVENPFYDRRQVVAALQTIDRDKPVGGLAFFAPDGLLVGLFLFQARSKVPAPFPVANSLANDYLLCGLPLLHRDYAEAVVKAWCEQVIAGTAPGVWVFDDVDMSSPAVLLLERHAKARRMGMLGVNSYARAFLTRLQGGFEAHLSQVLSKNRLKDVRRTMRRLGEVGAVTLEHVDAPDQLAQRLEDFLALEHAGWKGAMGTSFLAHDADAAFARKAYAPGLAAMDSLLLDGKPIAMKLSIRTGRTAFTPKIAYDESYKKLGPGMALEYMLIEDFYATDRLDAVDAAATAEGHSALNFFNNEKPMATLIIGRNGWQVTLLTRLHRLREELKLGVLTLKAKLGAMRAGQAKPVPEKPEA